MSYLNFHLLKKLKLFQKHMKDVLIKMTFFVYFSHTVVYKPS